MSMVRVASSQSKETGRAVQEQKSSALQPSGIGRQEYVVEAEAVPPPGGG
jgi:hypothetical protein